MKLFYIVLFALILSVLFAPVAIAATVDGSGSGTVSVSVLGVTALGVGCMFADKLVKMVRRKNGKTQTAEVNKEMVSEYRKGGYVLPNEKDWQDGEANETEALDDLTDKVDEVGKLKSNAALVAFVADNDIKIDLDDFSNIAERKAAIIAVLEG